MSKSLISFHSKLLKVLIICIFLFGNFGFGVIPTNSGISESSTSSGFTDRQDYLVRAGPGAIFIADVDNDLHPDIITSNKVNNTVSVLINNGKGVFNLTSNYTVCEGPMGVYVTDLGEDANNDLDIVTVGYYDNEITMLFNNGIGGFGNRKDYQIDAGHDPGPVDVFSADIDNDNDQDLAVCNHWDYSVSILKNNGDGTFAPIVNYDVGDRPYSIFLADLDQDLYVDLITANYIDSTITILTNSGTGNFQNRKDISVDAGPVDVWVSDIDNDGDNDIVTANQFADNVSVLINNGDGTFAQMVNYLVGQNPIAVFLADADNDSDNDIVTANEKADSISILSNNGKGTFGTLENLTVGIGPYDVSLGDFNLNGHNDLAAVNFGSNSVTVLLHNFFPTITILEPDGVDDHANTSYIIQWSGTDPDINELLTIDLYYIWTYYINNKLYNVTTPIILATSNDGNYTWDTTGIEEGNYTIYGEIKDGRGGIGFNHSLGNVTIVHNDIPRIIVLTPPGEGAEADTSFTIMWTDIDSDDDALINLCSDNDTIHNNTNHQLIIEGLSEDNEEDYYRWVTVNESEGEYYIFAEIYDNRGGWNYSYSLGPLRIDHNITNNTAPNITILEPDGVEDFADASYFITWLDYDPDDDAMISLHYDIDNKDYDGVKIAGNISEDNEINEFHWQTSNVPNGSYYIYAKIDDGLNLPVFNYSNGKVKISHKLQNFPPWLTIIEPDGIDDYADECYEIEWLDSDPDDNAEITFYYTHKNELFTGYRIVKGLSEDDDENYYIWDTSEIPDGKYYIYAKINDFVNDPVYNISKGQVVISHYKPPPSPGNEPPFIVILEPDGIKDFANTSYTILWLDNDPEDDAIITLYYDNDNLNFDGNLIVDKLSEDGDRDYYVWNTSDIPDGRYYIYAKITDSINQSVYNYSTGKLTIDHNISDEPTIFEPINAVISSPKSEEKYLTSDQILFDGSKSEGANLTYEWRSSKDGYLENLSVFYKSLSAGTHYVKLKITDNNNQTSIAEVYINVEEPSSQDQYQDDESKDDFIAIVALIVVIFIIIIIIFLLLTRRARRKPPKPKKK